jgi:predicted DNA-binding transcriptional regulator AlpA
MSESLLDTEKLDHILSKAIVCAWLGVSPSTIDRLEAEGTFPRRLRLSSGRVGWRRSDIEFWLRESELL